MDFDRWLQRFATRAEKILFRLALICVVLLFVVQAVLVNENVRLYLSQTDRLEGEPLLENAQEVFLREDTEETKIAPQKESALVLDVFNPPDREAELFLLINGEMAGRLEKDFYVTVNAGDLLEVWGEVPGGFPAVVRVKEVHGRLEAPEVGHEIKTFGEREILAWIIP